MPNGCTAISVDVRTGAYEVIVGPGAASAVHAFLERQAYDRTAVIADARVLELHAALLPDAIRERDTLALEGGEGAKEIQVLAQTLEFCAASKLSRGSCLVAFGGGTIGDLGGLTASLFKRGLDVVQVPTTLLAQVDASVGGKTAINLAAGKNLAGTFHQPRAVFCDTRALATLPDAEYASGLGEALKTAVIAGEGDLARIEARADALMQRDASALADTVADCVRAKARVVAEDPEEHGFRKVLNLGHTFAHAIEHAAGYGHIPHGVAVGTGLELAAAAAERAVGADPSLRPRITALLDRFGIPSSLAALRARYDARGVLTEDALRVGLGHDKKSAVGQPRFVLARAAGELEWDVPLNEDLLRELLSA